MHCVASEKKRSDSDQVGASGDWVYQAPGAVSRIEAFFSGVAYAPHRHDAYAIGVTVAGVQRFNYRGQTRDSLPGQVLVLHPDEEHDGRAGTDDGFHYRVVYLEPAMIQEVLGGKALPFIEGGISTDLNLQRAVMHLLGDFECDMEPLAYEDGLFEVATALDRVAGKQYGQRQSFDFKAAEMARTSLADHPEDNVSLETLERISGRNRWKLSRDFRVLYGTSPHRYQIMRRLDQVKARLLRGDQLADVAFACHFADQSHMNRHFKKGFGMTPKQWLVCQKASA